MVQKCTLEFSEKGYGITTRRLAVHLSGMRHGYLDEPVVGRKKHYTEVIAALGGDVFVCQLTAGRRERAATHLVLRRLKALAITNQVSLSC